MPITFNPLSGSVTHIEFVGTSGSTVSVVNDVDAEFEILSVDGLSPGTVTYSHPGGTSFADMVITKTTSSFTYASTFPYAHSRLTKYLYQPIPTAAAKQYLSVSSPHLLPPNDPINTSIPTYNGIYQVDPPGSTLVGITFTITGRERSITIDPETLITTYGDWVASTKTWIVNVQYSADYTATAIKLAVKGGTGYKKAILTYPEATL